MRAKECAALLLWVVLILVAGGLRLWSLELKPIHFDEGVNGWFVSQLWQEGYYHYDPTNYHGPLYFYLLQLSEAFFGLGLFSLRLIGSLFSIATIGLVYVNRKLIGPGAWLVAFILAVSPAHVFFARGAIHEPVFVFFQVLAFFAGWRWLQNGDRIGQNLFFVGILGCVLNKETWVLPVAAVVISWMCLERGRGLGDLKRKVVLGPTLGLILLAFMLVATGFGRDFEAPLRMVQAFIPWFKTGSGVGHEKPIWYWMTLILRYEWPLLAGFFVMPFLWLQKDFVSRFLLLFSLSLLVIYSAIPYKTPWCSISVFWPLAILVGYAVGRMEGVTRLGFQLGVGFLTIVSAHMSWNLNFKNYANGNEPYVYVQTTQEVGDVVAHILGLKKSQETFRDELIVVGVKDAWPLPYVFAGFSNLQYGAKSLPPSPAVAILSREDAERGTSAWPHMVRSDMMLRWEDVPISVFFSPIYAP